MRIRTDGVVTRRVGEDLMVLDLKSSQYFSVGGTGAFILDLLGESDVSQAQVVEALVAEYIVDVDRAAADVAAFVTRLDQAGLLLTS
jgi:hypothetical protein